MEICPCCNREKTLLEIRKMRLQKKLEQIKQEREELEKIESKQKKNRKKRKKRSEKKRNTQTMKDDGRDKISHEKKMSKKILDEEDEIVNKFSEVLKNTKVNDERIILSEETKSSIINMLKSFN